MPRGEKRTAGECLKSLSDTRRCRKRFCNNITQKTRFDRAAKSHFEALFLFIELFLNGRFVSENLFCGRPAFLGNFPDMSEFQTGREKSLWFLFRSGIK